MPTLRPRRVLRRYTAAGAIDMNATNVVLAATAGAAMTLADPPNNAGWNGHQMTIQCKLTQAHTITNTTGFNGNSTVSDVITLSGLNQACVIEALDGEWWIVSLHGGALA